jgi:hypothetical protein
LLKQKRAIDEADAEAEFLVTAFGLRHEVVPKTLPVLIQAAVEKFSIDYSLCSDGRPWDWASEKDHANWVFWARVWSRLHKGWSPAEALTLPLRGRRSS